MLALSALSLHMSSSSHAQTRAGYNTTSRADAYGNVRPRYASRRSVGTFQNPTQQKILRTYQTWGRRVDQRGGYSPFSLPGDVLRTTQFQPGRSIRSPYRAAGPSGWQKRVFDRYGGFRSHLGREQALRIDTILDRRHELIMATSLNAPVHRVYLQAPTSIGLPPSLAATPFVRDERGEPAESVTPFEERLGSEVGLECERVREDAWAWFEDGDYRRAARSFETVSLLEPSDFASRIGGLFCRVSLGATRTAISLLREFNVRDANPFLHDVNLTEAFGDPAEARRVRATVQLQAGIASDNADVRALHALVLWYLGERDEAVASAVSLARDHPGSAYRNWPSAMHAARSSDFDRHGGSTP